MTQRLMAAVTVAAFQLALAGCDNGGSAVATRARPDLSMEATSVPGGAPAAARRATEAKPVVTANRRETADVKVQRLFERNGADFGASTAGEYLQKVEAFTHNPPDDAEKAQRPNGDVLIYQASTNTFAVIDREGTPRTMFKPDSGATYWAEQKANAASFGQRRANQG